MKRVISAVATVATLFAASPVAAAEHMILILEDAYFPQVTYLERGDTVRFVNASGTAHNIIAKNDSWEIGPIAIDGEATLLVEDGVQKTFYDVNSAGENGGYSVTGQMSYSSAPLQ
ncbi:MAG: hypothetical protein ABJR46_15720 [Tateyamaria sp.]|uniref:cupredoxin domain-containing protein n=1 Tax=Tateyamaria sp. TaxID=1929288 RepID=UPI00329ECD53